MRSRRVLFPVWVLLALLAGGPTARADRAGEVRTRSFELINQGVTAYKNGDYGTAVEKLRLAASMALNNFRAHFYLGLALNGDRRYSEAIAALDIALELDPDHLQSLVAQGDAYLKLGDLGEARAAYFRALKFRPEYPAALDGLARVYESQADEEQAVQHFLRAISSNRGFAPAYTHLGDLYLRRNMFEEAVELLEEAVQVRPDFAAGMNRLSLAYGRLGLTNEAIATIQKAMEIEPSNAAHPATLGLLQLDQGSLRAAEASFNVALELDDGQPDALQGLGEVARRRGMYPLALQFIDTALEDPRLDALHAARLRGFRDEIVEEQEQVGQLEETVYLGEPSSEDYAQLALIYADRGLWDQAVVLQVNVESSRDQQERLAYMLFRAHRYRKAYELYSRLAAESATVESEINTGVTLAMLGNDADAVAAYRRALAIDPEDRTAKLFLGNSLLRLGRYDEAIAAYREFLMRAERGERAERVRRILRQIAPEALPEDRSPLAPPSGPLPDLDTAGKTDSGGSGP